MDYNPKDCTSTALKSVLMSAAKSDQSLGPVKSKVSLSSNKRSYLQTIKKGLLGESISNSDNKRTENKANESMANFKEIKKNNSLLNKEKSFLKDNF